MRSGPTLEASRSRAADARPRRLPPPRARDAIDAIAGRTPDRDSQGARVSPGPAGEPCAARNRGRRAARPTLRRRLSC
ncbi:hypothetical protein ABD05_29385 [Burkholderia pyrrocinia]|nr:hypothetical protein ABD05_29385 [Burkholderia pyrrocinia]